MNTPAHIAASILVFRHEPGWRGAAAVSCGAVLPDAPMFAFYAYQKSIGSSESLIWSTLYFQEHWQTFFDVFNSIPLAVALIALSVWLRSPLSVLVWLNAFLHMLCDLPLHHDDAHRHFWPLSWRFASPISYWDSRHYGHYFAIIELIFAIGGSCYVAFSASHKPMRIVGRINFCLYVVGIAFAVAMWAQFIGA